MLDKILEETSDNIEIAVVWAINAKNWFFPYQLAIGQNPNLPSTYTDEPAAMTCLQSHKNHSKRTLILVIQQEKLSFKAKALKESGQDEQQVPLIQLHQRSYTPIYIRS